MTSLLFLFTLLQKEKKKQYMPIAWTELFYIQINLYPFEWEFVCPTYGNCFWN